MKRPLVIIAGPTAAGKTALSVRLAKNVGGEIISADSMQVYRRMDIGTAKVTPEETEGVPHHLIDILEPSEPFNVYEFRNRVLKAMEEIYARGHLPVICGGTGFYIQSVLYDIAFGDDAGSPEVRSRLEKEMAELGPGAMHARLAACDPVSAAAIHENNRKRVIRALEYYELTGKRISEHNAEQRERTSPYDFLYYVLTMDRESLYARINYRVDLMVRDGLLDEVRALRDEGVPGDCTAMQGLGYRQVYDYLDGLCTFEEAVERIKTETRHFAKRQLTWFKREKDAIWIRIEDYGGDRGRILRKMTEDTQALLLRSPAAPPEKTREL